MQTVESTKITPTVQAKATEEKPFFAPNSRQEVGGKAFLAAAMRVVMAFFKPRSQPVIQAKLTIGRPGDKYEQEADRMAERVVSQPAVQRQELPEEEEKINRKPLAAEITPLVQRKALDKEPEKDLQRQTKEPEEEPPVQAKTEHGSTSAPANLQSRLDTTQGSGNPLPADTRSQMENAFGADFGSVRVHTGSDAAGLSKDLNAQAFTHGSDVYFNEGKYRPETTEGRRLLGHELVHVVQQGKCQGVQRKCGKGEVGQQSGCEGMSSTVEGEKFLFEVNCDDFKPGEEARLRNYVDTSLPADQFDFEVHGFASEEGPPDYNDELSCTRAKKAYDVISIQLQKSMVVKLVKHGPVPGNKQEWRSVIIKSIPKPFEKRKLNKEEKDLLMQLKALEIASKGEGKDGKRFSKALRKFRKTLQQKIEQVGAFQPLTPDLQVVINALLLWSRDPGNKWGEGSWDSTDLQLSAPEYALVPASQSKCNAYVAEVLYQSLGIVHKVHTAEKGKYFPHRAAQWGDPQLTIPNFTIEANPKMGDIWSSGTHVGIFLGSYNSKYLYISARDDGDGVYGLKSQIQKEHGIQIKYIPVSGVFRRYTGKSK